MGNLAVRSHHNERLSVLNEAFIRAGPWTRSSLVNTLAVEPSPSPGVRWAPGRVWGPCGARELHYEGMRMNAAAGVPLEEGAGVRAPWAWRVWACVLSPGRQNQGATRWNGSVERDWKEPALLRVQKGAQDPGSDSGRVPARGRAPSSARREPPEPGRGRGLGSSPALGWGEVSPAPPGSASSPGHLRPLTHHQKVMVRYRDVNL